MKNLLTVIAILFFMQVKGQVNVMSIKTTRVTEYTSDILFGATAIPSGKKVANYYWSKINNHVSVVFFFEYDTNGMGITELYFVLPDDVPNPSGCVMQNSMRTKTKDGIFIEPLMPCDIHDNRTRIKVEAKNGKYFINPQFYPANLKSFMFRIEYDII